jgi:hypothetical protein
MGTAHYFWQALYIWPVSWCLSTPATRFHGRVLYMGYVTQSNSPRLRSIHCALGKYQLHQNTVHSLNILHSIVDSRLYISICIYSGLARSIIRAALPVTTPASDTQFLRQARDNSSHSKQQTAINYRHSFTAYYHGSKHDVKLHPHHHTHRPHTNHLPIYPSTNTNAPSLSVSERRVSLNPHTLNTQASSAAKRHLSRFPR